jgi:hypothetical protein
MLKDLYQSRKILTCLGLNYKNIDVCEKNCMLFWKEHKDDTEYMHCDRSKYVKVVNDDGVSLTTKVATTTSLHAYYAKTQTVVPIQRNNKANEVT